MMIFTVSTMSHVCLLMVVSMLSAVNGHQNNVVFQKERDIESSWDDNTDIQRRQATVKCGRILAAASKRDDESEQSQLLDKILGGSFVKRGEIPWQVNINVDGSHKCGGAIVNTHWILTTASCIDPKKIRKDSLSLVVGDHDLSVDEKEQQKFRADKIIIFKDFYTKALANDIGLIKLRATNGKGIQFNNYVQPACLPLETDEHPVPGEALTVSGWGLDSASATQPSNVLKKGTLLVENGICSKIIPNWIQYTSMLCGKGLNNKDNVCRGDLGGPAIHQVEGTSFLVGIIAGGDGCSAPNNPVAMTSVRHHWTWVLKTIAAHSKGSEGTIPNSS